MSLGTITAVIKLLDLVARGLARRQRAADQRMLKDVSTAITLLENYRRNSQLDDVDNPLGRMREQAASAENGNDTDRPVSDFSNPFDQG